MASIHHQGFKGLASATISQALKNMRRTGSPSEDDYIDAVVWLGSNRAIRFFDPAGISQGPALLAMGGRRTLWLLAGAVAALGVRR